MKRSAPSGPLPDLAAAEGKSARTLAEATYFRLRSDIVWGVLPPGTALRSDELRATYEVGVSPLREALTRLTAEQLVVSVGQRGFRVAPISPANVVDVMETRLVIETAALSRSIREGGLDWETRVVAAFHALSGTTIPRIPGPDAEAWASAHRAFHMALLGACGSVWQLHLADLLFDQAERFRNIRARDVPTGRLNRDTAREHTEIFEAAMQRRIDDALAALDAHYRATVCDVLHAIDADDHQPAR